MINTRDETLLNTDGRKQHGISLHIDWRCAPSESLALSHCGLPCFSFFARAVYIVYILYYIHPYTVYFMLCAYWKMRERRIILTHIYILMAPRERRFGRLMVRVTDINFVPELIQMIANNDLLMMLLRCTWVINILEILNRKPNSKYFKPYS